MKKESKKADLKNFSEARGKFVTWREFDLLVQRVSRLEKKIFGKSEPEYPNFSSPSL